MHSMEFVCARSFSDRLCIFSILFSVKLPLVDMIAARWQLLLKN
jgi:hypothetical protein